MVLDKLKGLSVQTPMVFFFMVLMLLAMMKVRIHNKMLVFLGKISLEIILINYLFIMTLDFIRVRYGMLLYLALVVVCTLCVAIVLYKIKQIILERDKKRTHIINLGGRTIGKGIFGSIYVCRTGDFSSRG